MKLSLLLLILATILFLLSSLPKVSRSWMISIGLALLTLSFMPFFSMRLGD